MATEKILLDTDIGSDIDDAVCLAWLLANPACDLLGITTVTGEAELRASLASVLCRAAGREVPIFPGNETPVAVPQKQPRASQAAALSKWPHDTGFPKGRAVEFLRETIRDNPGEVTLLTIGPLTNIGRLFEADPAIPGLLKRLVMMCGVFENFGTGYGWTEWNATLDPHATAVVYSAGVKVHRSVGLDVTTRVAMPAVEVKRRFSHPLLKPVLDFAEAWFAHTDRIVFHDPLAAVSVWDDRVCRFERGFVEVELADVERMGFLRWQAGLGPHEVAVGVDPDRFFDRYFRVFEEEAGG